MAEVGDSVPGIGHIELIRRDDRCPQITGSDQSSTGFGRQDGYGIRVTTPDKLKGALDEALARNGPALVEIVTDADLI